MKKSIKYAGIAAATLLTVAPIAAPVVSNATTVQAAADTATQVSNYISYVTKADDNTTSVATEEAKGAVGDVVTLKNVPSGYTIDEGNQYTIATLGGTAANPILMKVTKVDTDLTNDDITKAAGSLQDVLADTTFGGSYTSFPSNLVNQDYDEYVKVSDFAGSPVYNALSTKLSSKNLNTLSDPKVNGQIRIWALNDDGSKMTNADYKNAVQDAANNGGSIKYSYTLTTNDKDGKSFITKDGSFTFTNNSDYVASKTLNTSFTTPFNVAYGSKTVNAKLASTSDIKITDQQGKAVDLNDDDTVMGGLYKSLKGAKAQTSSDEFTDSTFGNEDKTYYQPVTVTIKDNKLGIDNGVAVTAQSIYNKYIAGEDNYAFTINGSQLNASEVKDLAISGNTLTFIREVKVSQNASWDVKDVKGIVTTKTDSSFYTLKNGDNQTISDRALAKNTAWQTNAVRTDQNGNKQYRVGADEWIDANNVTFSDKATDNNGEGAYTDVKALNGKVTTAGPEGFYYPLYDDNGKMVSDRGVSGLSAWYTDKSAVNANGDTVYHVATGEWLQGKNVTYTAY